MIQDLLPCGRDAQAVWDDADDDRLDLHEQTCSYCQGVLSERTALTAPLQDWRETALAVPPVLLDQVMVTIRSGLRAREYIPVPSLLGPVRLDRQVAAGILRWIVDGVEGATARTCRVGISAPVAGTSAETPTLVAALSVATTLGTDLPRLAAAIRQAVIESGSELLGVPIQTVDIEIADVTTSHG